MSGSRLGRGRGGRLAVYGVCGAGVLLLVFLYRAATSEMARLRDLHEQCAHQQEALAAQLQVIFEYKVRLEKSLAEEKSSNAAVKQELQQRATREKSLRDKDSVEAMQRFNSLQQTYKLLQTEHQDLQEECKKRQKQALEETNRLETTLQDLRGRLRQAGEEKASAVETLKTKYQELDTEKIKLEEKYNELLDTNGNAGSTIEHLKKEASQLRRELDSLKKTCVRSTSPSLITSSRATASQLALQKGDSKPIPAPQQQQQQQNAAHDFASSRKAENSTVANNVSPSVVDKPAPLPIRPLSKIKLPVGVLPIPEMILQKDNAYEEKREEEIRKRDDAVAHNNLQPPPLKLAPADIKEKKEPLVEAGNLDPPFAANPPAVRHVGEQIERRANDGWFGVRPGVQEVGEELNQLGRVPGLDDGQGNGGDDQYDGGDYDKEPQKNDIRLAESEDEGEDEGDMLEYPNNLKQEKRE